MSPGSPPVFRGHDLLAHAAVRTEVVPDPEPLRHQRCRRSPTEWPSGSGARGSTRRGPEAGLETPPTAPTILLFLNDQGAQQLALATREAIQGRRLAIVVDREAVAAPTISTPTTIGETHIIVQGDIDQVFDALTRAPR